MNERTEKSTTEIAIDISNAFLTLRLAAVRKWKIYIADCEPIEKVKALMQVIDSNQSTWSGGPYGAKNIEEAANRWAATYIINNILNDLK